MTYRRSPDAIITAHIMDRSRRSLFVEGPRDRSFLQHLAMLGKDALIVEASSIEMPDGAVGGERGRLIQFAELIEQADVAVACFIDSDWDRILGTVCPSCCLMTDFRDLEGYLLDEACVMRALVQGMGISQAAANDIFTDVVSIAKTAGFIRIHSARSSLDLPFQRSRIDRSTDLRDGRLHFDALRYVETLLQNASASRTLAPGIIAAAGQVGVELGNEDYRDIVHGKDVLALLRKAIPSFIDPILWAAFDSANLPEFANLSSAVAFLED